MHPSNINADVKPQLGEDALGKRRYKQPEFDHKGVWVVGIAWLLFYGIALAGVALKQGSDMLASLY